MVNNLKGLPLGASNNELLTKIIHIIIYHNIFQKIQKKLSGYSLFIVTFKSGSFQIFPISRVGLGYYRRIVDDYPLTL